jgi:hypothetical protein
MFFWRLVAGRQPGDSFTPYSPRQIAAIIIDAQTDMPQMRAITPEDESFWEFLTGRYRINTDEIDIYDGIILYIDGAFATEIAVLRLEDKANVSTVKDLLAEYTSRRMSAFGGYAPTQAALLGNSIVSVQGNHVALFVAEDSRSAELAFLACFGDDPQSLPESVDLLHNQNAEEYPDYPNEAPASPEGIFDPDSILRAW